jgi:hypothetical protein
VIRTKALAEQIEGLAGAENLWAGGGHGPLPLGPETEN